jgi:hypothetical protein
MRPVRLTPDIDVVLGIDVLHDAPGAPPYNDDLRQRALEVHLGDLFIAVAGCDDLIAMTRASGRPVDLDDLTALTEPEQQASGSAGEGS